MNIIAYTCTYIHCTLPSPHTVRSVKPQSSNNLLENKSSPANNRVLGVHTRETGGSHVRYSAAVVVCVCVCVINSIPAHNKYHRNWCIRWHMQCWLLQHTHHSSSRNRAVTFSQQVLITVCTLQQYTAVRPNTSTAYDCDHCNGLLPCVAIERERQGVWV